MIKYNNIICCIAKDETPYLKEWVEHHVNIGVQYFVIYDNNSIIPIKETLAEYIRKRLVNVIDCPIASRPQLRAYNHCLFHMCEKTQWIIYIDVDEFIILNKHNEISNLLIEYDSFGGLSLNWKLYNAGGHVTTPAQPVMEAYKEYLPLTSAVNKHVKTILQPRYTLTIGNSHQAMYIDGYYAVNENYRHVSYAFSDFSNEIAHINHYYTKSYADWLCKVEKGRADSDQKRKEQEFWDYNPKMIRLKDTIREKFKNLTGNSATLIVKSVIQPNYSEWSPLFSGFEKQKVKSCLEQIKVTLSKYDEKPLGLFKGQSGISLYLFNLGKLTNDPTYDDWANEVLESIIINIRAVFANHSFANGLCGIGWLIEYLAQNRFIENNTNEILSDLDDLFKDSIFNLLDFSLTNGLLSYGMYFLSRLTNPENFNIEQKELLVQLVNYLECFLPDNAQEADEPENLTMLHGYLAVIPFLCKLYAININRYKVLCAIEKYVRFILSFESQQNTNLCFPNQTQDGTYMLQWNCGDLAVANALLQAAKVSENKDWENKALQIALRTLAIKAIKDPGTSLISGTAGIAHLYNQFYQYYYSPEFKEAAIFWLHETMRILKEQKYDLSAEYGLTGLSGTALVLLSSISEMPPFWDPLFSL